MTDQMTVLERTLPVPRYELTVEDVLAQAEKVHQVAAKAMKEGEHYGVIPGTAKPTLLQPGAQKLLLTFRLDPQYASAPIGADQGGGGHLAIKSVCTLYHIPTGERMGSGEGSCSTREEKYAYRKAARVCPSCGGGAIIRGKEQYGGGWVCFGKKGGCGAKFKDGDAEIEAQAVGRVANEGLADSYNTVLKMANKRALVAAILNVTAASDVFTQDLEDMTPEAPPTASKVPPEAEPSGVEMARNDLLMSISEMADRQAIPKRQRGEMWQAHFGEHIDPRTVDLVALQEFYAKMKEKFGE